MPTPEEKRLPGPGVLTAMRGLFRDGFLAYVDKAWRTYGDTFQLRLGLRDLIFAIHPEAVRQINITSGQSGIGAAAYAAHGRSVTILT